MLYTEAERALSAKLRSRRVDGASNIVVYMNVRVTIIIIHYLVGAVVHFPFSRVLNLADAYCVSDF